MDQDQPGIERTRTSDLHDAVRKGRRGSIVRHINEGSDVNALDQEGNTALTGALKYASEDIAFDLLKAGADIKIKSRDSLTPLLVAASEGKDRVLQQLLVQKGDISETDNSGNTALHMAAGARGPARESTISLLLNARADLHLENANGYTPYGIASDMGGLQAAQLLESKGGTRTSQRNAAPLPMPEEEKAERTTEPVKVDDVKTDLKIDGPGIFEKPKPKENKQCCNVQ